MPFNQPGNILISDQFNNRTLECDIRGRIVWSFGKGPNDFTADSILGVNDAERVGKLTLMTGTGIPPDTIPEAPAGAIDSRVIFVNEDGEIVWQYGQFGVTGSGPNLLNFPVQATFVPGKKHHTGRKSGCHCNKHHRHHHKAVFEGTVLITDQGNNRIIEVNERKKIVWEFSTGLSDPNSAERLRNGNTLIADEGNSRAIEVNKDGDIVRIFTAQGALGECAFASRLDDGHTLLTDASNNRIINVDRHDNIIWQYITNAEFNSIPNPNPSRGLRLRNRDTIISDQFNNRVIVINRTNTIVAYYGLPLADGSGTIGDNKGYDVNTTQLGLYAPYDAKVIGDYTGITPV